MRNRHFLFLIFLVLSVISCILRVNFVEAVDSPQAIADNLTEDTYFIYLPLIMRPGLKNGGFESGNDGSWTLYSYQGFIDDIIYIPGGSDLVQAYQGSYLAWLGGYQNELTQVSQQVFISPDMPYLSYWYWIESSDDCGYDFFRVKVNGTVIQTMDLCSSNASADWENGVLNLSPYVNKTIALMFEVTTNETSENDPYGSNLYLDHISLQ
jgi:hypothetical protein